MTLYLRRCLVNKNLHPTVFIFFFFSFFITCKHIMYGLCVIFSQDLFLCPDRVFIYVVVSGSSAFRLGYIYTRACEQRAFSQAKCVLWCDNNQTSLLTDDIVRIITRVRNSGLKALSTALPPPLSFPSFHSPLPFSLPRPHRLCSGLSAPTLIFLRLVADTCAAGALRWSAIKL